MKLIWLGHGSFRLETEDRVLLIDPWLEGNPSLPEEEYAAAKQGATHILLTHAHFDHASEIVALAKELGVPVVGQYDVVQFWADSEGIDTVAMNKGGTVDLGGVLVSMVNAVHSSSFPTPEGPRAGGSEAGYMIKAEGKTVYHSGDTDIMADMAWFGEYYNPDIGILSAGGYFTMDMKAAAWAARKYFNFKTVIPGHFKTFPILEQSAQDLKDALPGVNVVQPEVMKPIEL